MYTQLFSSAELSVPHSEIHSELRRTEWLSVSAPIHSTQYQRFPRLPEPSRIRETSNTWSRIWYRLGVSSVPDLVLEPLNYLFSVSVLVSVSF